MGGEDWWASILQQIRNCDAFIFAMTKASVNSRICLEELNYAHALHKPIFPVALEEFNYSQLPQFILQIRVLDYTKSGPRLALALDLASNKPTLTLPEPLPAEPPLPLSPLSFIHNRLYQPTLSPNEQLTIVTQLEEIAQDSNYTGDVRILLERMLNRHDLLASTEQSINIILGKSPSLNSSTSAETPTVRNSATPAKTSELSPSNTGLSNQHDIFVSYAREDIELLSDLVDRLEAMGLTVWTDSALERGTKSFAREIKNAVKRARLFVVLCSPESEQSEWVENEIAMAQEYDKMIFPVLLRGKAIDAIPARLITYQRYDLTDDYQGGFDKLMKALKANL